MQGITLQADPIAMTIECRGLQGSNLEQDIRVASSVATQHTPRDMAMAHVRVGSQVSSSDCVVAHNAL